MNKIIVLGLALILALSSFAFAEISIEEERLLREDGQLEQQMMEAQQRLQLITERRIEVRGVLKYLRRLEIEKQRVKEEAEQEAEECGDPVPPIK